METGNGLVPFETAYQEAFQRFFGNQAGAIRAVLMARRTEWETVQGELEDVSDALSKAILSLAEGIQNERASGPGQRRAANP